MEWTSAFTCVGDLYTIFPFFASCAEGFFRSDTPFSFIWFDSFLRFFYGYLLGGGKGFLLIRYEYGWKWMADMKLVYLWIDE
jgi:hypothetical protein